MQKRNEVRQYEVIIGRAYGDEPIKLVPIRDRGSAIEVIRENETESKAIGFRKEWLYSFKPELFDRLRSAYQEGDSVQLSHLWATAERYST